MEQRQRINCFACLNCCFNLIGLLTLLVATKPTYSQVNTCGFTTTDASREISSPNYPQQYPENTLCQWNIILPPSETIGLVFVMFDIEPSSTGRCDNDFVKIYDGSNVLGKFCAANHPPRQITSRTNTLRIIFKSDNRTSPAYPGFLAAYASCGGYFTEPRGYLDSPGYPKPFRDDIQCTWQIRVPQDYVVELKFDDFFMDGQFPCSLDYVKVRDGLNVSATQIGHYCGTRSPGNKPIRSTGNTLSVEFNSFQESTSQGFKAHYARVPHCGGFLENDYGRFSSPGYPGSRQVDNECEWIITVSTGRIVSLMFDSFEVDSESFSSHDCDKDFVEIYDGTDQNAERIGKFCRFGHSPPSKLRSSGQQMMVRLKTSYFNKGNGFLASYYGVDPSNYFVGCSEFAHQLLFTCDNGRKVHCEWKCDGTNDCGDGSDEKHCAPTTPAVIKKSDDVRNYVIIILSITGSILAIVCIGFIVDRLRRKRSSRTRRRRGQRRRHPRLSNTDQAPLTEEPSSPPPPYELAINEYSCDYFGVPCTHGRQGRADAGPLNAQSQNPDMLVSPQSNNFIFERTHAAHANNELATENNLQSALWQSELSSELPQSGLREGEHSALRDTNAATVSPAVSVGSLNDTVPLIQRSSSTVEI